MADPKKPTPRPGANGAYMPGGEVYETEKNIYNAQMQKNYSTSSMNAKDAAKRAAAAKAAKKRAETSYKLPGGRTKYDSYGVKNGFKSAD